MGRIRNGAVLTTQDEYSALGSAENVVRAVEAGIGGATGDVAGVEESIDVVKSPVVSWHVFEDRYGCC